MAQKIYITSGEARSGKSLAVLGIMELFAGSGQKVGFFKPLIASEDEVDPCLDFIMERYKSTLPYDSLYGCTATKARELINSGQYNELIKLILDRFKTLEKECELILCIGSDYTHLSPALEFDFNTDIANNLDCPLLFVVNGQSASVQEVVERTVAVLDSLEERRCDILSLIVNRVSPRLINDVSDSLEGLIGKKVAHYVVPESSILAKPTVGNVADILGAVCISAEHEWQYRQISTYTVAAMELPNFLDYIQSGSLVIVPGDRSDIILGSLLSYSSTTYPQIAALLLTGGLKPARQVSKLVEGLGRFPVPILSVPTDTFTTAMNVNALGGTFVAGDLRKIAAALGIMEASVDLAALKEHISMKRTGKVTPLMFEYNLVQRAKEKRCHIVLPEGSDERILRAAEIVRLRGVAKLTLLGNVQEVMDKIASLGLRLDNIEILDPRRSRLKDDFAKTYYELRKHKKISEQMAYDLMTDVSYFGTMMVHLGHADGMVSGAVHTTQHTIRPSFEIIKTRPGCSIVSSVFFMCLADRVLVFGDCAVNPDPDPQQLADIAISSAETARMFGIEQRVAMLSYSTGESGKGKDVEKVRAAVNIARNMRPELRLEGPIQYDAAIDPNVAAAKMPDSDVAGKATIFIFPDLNTGNNTYKAVQRSANAVAIGPILQGLNKPVNDLSRGCTVADIVNTITITAIQAQEEIK
ncbi:MAG: phosphate acetyltransferase [Desulfobulbaceae bacterium]|nr:phosphate acetyltransferase [Desulfobulbaceae bacterium]